MHLLRCVLFGAALFPLAAASAAAQTTHSGKLIGYQVDGDGNVATWSMDTNNDGVADEVFTCTLPNRYASIMEDWRENGTLITFGDTDEDDNVDTNETVGPPLAS